jgi:hypothetical protein
MKNLNIGMLRATGNVIPNTNLSINSDLVTVFIKKISTDDIFNSEEKLNFDIFRLWNKEAISVIIPKSLILKNSAFLSITLSVWNSKYFQNKNFIGAIDSAVSCALLLDIANYLNQNYAVTSFPNVFLKRFIYLLIYKLMKFVYKKALQKARLFLTVYIF